MNDDVLISGGSNPWIGEPQPGYRPLSLAESIAEARKPERFVAGDALYGWRIVDTPPVNELAMTWGGQNFVRSELNDLLNPRGLLGSNLGFSRKSAELIANAEGKQLDPWRDPWDVVYQMLPFGSSNERDLAPILDRKDPDFNGRNEWHEWEKQNPEVARFLREQRGFNPEQMVWGARNRQAFMFSINMEMEIARLQQDVDQYDKYAGTYAKWSQFLGGGAIREFILDSDAAKTVGLLGIGKGLKVGASAVRATGALAKVPGASKALDMAQRAGGVGSFIHNTLANRLHLTTWGAIAAEGFATGAGYSIQHQLGTAEIARWLGRSNYEFDYSDVLATGALGATFGLGTLGAIKGLGRLSGGKADAAQNMLNSVGVGDSPIVRHGLTPEGLTLQAMEEDAIVRINSMLAEATDSRLGFLLSKGVIEGAGRTMPEAVNFAEGLMKLRQSGMQVSDAAIVEALDDFLGQGTLKHLTTAQRRELEKVIGLEESLRVRQADPEWVAQMNRERNEWADIATTMRGFGDEELSPEFLDTVFQKRGIKFKRAVNAEEAFKFASDRMTEIDNLLRVPANLEEAMARLAPDAKLGQYVPKSAAGRILMDMQRHFTTIQEQLALGGKGSGNAIKAAREELKRLNASLNKLYGKVSKPPAVRPAKAFHKLPPAQQTKALEELFERFEGTPTEVWHSTNMISRGLNAIGYTGTLRNWISERTGAAVTSRSEEPLMRATALLFGDAEYGAAVASGRGGQGVGLVAAMSRAASEPYRLRHMLESMRHMRGMTPEAWRDFNETVASAMNRKTAMPKDHPFAKQGNEYIALHKEYNEALMRRGIKTRSLRPNRKELKQSDFLPRLLNEAWVQANFKEAVRRVASVFLRKAQRSELVNPVIAEKLGWIERPVDAWGNRVGKTVWKKQVLAVEPEAGKSIPRFIKREDLSPDFKAEYDRAVADFDFTDSAETFLIRHLRQDGRATDVRTLNDKVHGANAARTRLARRITQRDLEEFPELKDLYIQDLFTLVDHQARTVGFATHAAESLARMTGFNGVSPTQVMNVIESKLKFIRKGDPEGIKEITKGFDALHDKLAWMTGQLPDVDPSYANGQKFFYDFLGKSVSIPILGKQAGINVVEGARSLFFAVHDPVDIGRNVKAFVRGLFADRATLREEFAGMHNDLRRLSTSYGNLLRMGNVDAGFELTTRGQLMRPWEDAYNILRGRQRSPKYSNRFAAASISALEGIGRAAYTIGLGPRIQHATEVVMGRAMQREFLRFGEATIKLRELMKANPVDVTDALNGHKQFVGLARKAGFGDRWDVAERIIRYNLHEDGITESLLKAAKNSGYKSHIHATLNDMLEQQIRLKGPDKDLLNEATSRYRQLIEERVMEEMGETQFWSARAAKRTALRQALDLMTNYMHNIYFYKISKPSVMPSRAFLGILTGYVISETLQKILQDFLNGKTESEIADQWDTPEEAVGQVLSNSTRLPLFGSMSFIPKYVLDSSIDTVNSMMGNQPVDAYQPKYGGVIGSGLDSIYRMGKGLRQWAFSLRPADAERGKYMALNASLRYLPVVNSAYGQAATRMLTDWKQRNRRNLPGTLPTSDGIAPVEAPVQPVGEKAAPAPTFDLGEALRSNK